MRENKIFTTGWEDYELIDAGGGRKFERFGQVYIIRPEIQAYFRSGKPFDEWYEQAHWEFVEGKGKSGKWKSLKTNAPESWTIDYKSLKFKLELTGFKHIGIFPEQKINWDLLDSKLNENSSFLNLFAYTGAASCVARNAGAETTHVDSVKQLISRAAENMELSRLLNIKWVHEDALKFVNRLVKRQAQFDAIVMDPPTWGIGANKEKWKLEDKLDDLMSGAASILKKDGLLIMNTYSPKVDLKMIHERLELYFHDRKCEVNELWMKTTTGKELFYGNLLRVH